MWILTGDKIETTKQVAIQAKMFSKSSTYFQLNENNYESIETAL